MTSDLAMEYKHSAKILQQYKEDSDEEDGDFGCWEEEGESDEEDLDLSLKLTLSVAKQSAHEHDKEWVRDIDERVIQQEAEKRHLERQIRVKIEPFLKEMDLLKDYIVQGDVTQSNINVMEMCRGIMQAYKETKIMEDVVASRAAGHINYLLDAIFESKYGLPREDVEPLIHLLRACVKVSVEMQEAIIYYGLFPKVYDYLFDSRNSDSLLALVRDFCLGSDIGLKLFIATGGVQRVILPFLTKSPEYTDVCLSILSQIQCLHHASLVANLLNHDSSLIDTLTQLLIDLSKVPSTENRRRVESIIQINITLHPTQNPNVIRQLVELLSNTSSLTDASMSRSLFTYMQSMTFNSKTALQMVAQGLLHVMVENRIFTSPILDHVIGVLFNQCERSEKLGKKFATIHSNLKEDCQVLMENCEKRLTKAQAKAVFLALD